MKKFLCILVLILFFLSCGKKVTYELKEKYIDKPAYGDILIDSSIGEPATLNPVLASDSASHDIIGLLFNGLVKFDENLKIVGDLAEKWDISKDGKIITFYLRKGIKWQDGVEFTAKDVKFTYDSFMKPDVKTAYRSLFEPIEKIEIIDDYTLKVYYKFTFAPALQYWGTSIIPEHILKDKDLNTAEFNRNPVGTGPYKFDKWKTTQQLELIANNNYFEGRPYISKYIYRIIPDQSVQFMELLSGGIDQMVLTSELYVGEAAKEEFLKKFNKFAITSFSYVYIGYNLLNDLFKNKNVRKAISFAINKDEIITGVKRGLAKKITGPFIPGSWAYDENAESYDYNPEKAKELLQKEGWKKGDDGYLYKNGKKFEFILLTNQGNKEREEIATIVQQQLGKIGIKVNIRILAWSTLITEFIDKKKFDAIVLGWNITQDPDCYDIWHSSKTKEGEFNFISYRNSRVDELVERGRKIFDVEERKKIYREVHRIIADDAPYTFLYSPLTLPVVHKRFHGIKPALAGISYNFIKWYVPQELQKYKITMEK